MRAWIVILLGITGLVQVPASLVADELVVDLQAQDASKDWLFLDKTARIKDGELVFDGRQRISRAVYTPQEWSDVTLRAKFLVEPQAEGVLACGFVVRAVDGSSYYYVHFDRASAILVRHSQGSEWNEIKRVSVSDRPAGQWHEAQLECHGNTLRVSLNGKVLYEAKDDTLAAGRIGFYGSQGLVRVKDIRVAGTAQKPAGDFVIPPPAFVYVCEDAGAGGYEAFPDVCRLNDGRLMCVFYAGYGHVALPNEQLPRGGRISYCLSSDEGRTWSRRPDPVRRTGRRSRSVDRPIEERADHLQFLLAAEEDRRSRLRRARFVDDRLGRPGEDLVRAAADLQDPLLQFTDPGTLQRPLDPGAVHRRRQEVAGLGRVQR